MGLFSASKLLVLALIIAVVWYGFKLISRRNQNVGARQPRGHIGARRRETPDPDVQDMESCPVCGTFVPNASAKACGRDGCPYPD